MIYIYRKIVQEHYSTLSSDETNQPVKGKPIKKIGILLALTLFVSARRLILIEEFFFFHYMDEQLTFTTAHKYIWVWNQKINIR